MDGVEDLVRVVHRPDAEVCARRLLRWGLPVLRRYEGHLAERLPSCSHVSRPSKRWFLLINLHRIPDTARP